MNSSGLPSEACTWPPSSAVSASPPLLKLTVLSCMPVDFDSTVTAITSVVPPVEKSYVFAGLDFASLTNSRGGLPRRVALTKKRKSSSITFITGALRSASWPRGLRSGVIWVLPLISTSVCGSALRAALM